MTHGSARHLWVLAASTALVMGCSGKVSQTAGGSTGDPCTEHSDCEGVCFDPGGGDDTYCTDTCDPSDADSCPDGYLCTEITGIGSVCIAEDLGALGDDCTDGSDCASGFCNGDVCSQCEDDGDCPGGGTCVDDTDGVGYFVCEGGLGALGDDCTDGADCISGFCNGDLCSECEDDGDCTGEETCVDDTDGVGYFVCLGPTLGALGDVCVDGAECDSGFCYNPPGPGPHYCSECAEDTDCDPTQVCYMGTSAYASCVGSAVLGDDCTSGADCMTGFCNGDVCSECESATDCTGGGLCVDDTGGVGYFVCEGALGDTCTDGSECGLGFCFNPPGPGAWICSECAEDTDCGVSQTCTMNWGEDWATCQGSAVLGEDCTSGADCVSGFCNGDVCSECESSTDCTGGGTCEDDTGGVGYFVCTGGLGDPCTSGTDCDSGFCYDVTWGGPDVCSECAIDDDCTAPDTCEFGWGDTYATCQ